MTIFVNATINFYLSSKALTQFENRVLEATLSNALSERIMMLQGKKFSFSPVAVHITQTLYSLGT